VVAASKSCFQSAANLAADLGYLPHHETWMLASKTTWKKTKYGRGEPKKNTFALKHIRFTQGRLHLPAAWMY